MATSATPRRYIDDVAPSGAVRIATGADEATLAAAADISLFATRGVPERVAIDAAIRSAAAIVAPATLWHRERLYAAADRTRLFALRKPRNVARALLEASDMRDGVTTTAATALERLPGIDAQAAADAWRRLLAQVAR